MTTFYGYATSAAYLRPPPLFFPEPELFRNNGLQVSRAAVVSKIFAPLQPGASIDFRRNNYRQTGDPADVVMPDF